MVAAPAPIPVTTPVALTFATALLLVAQLPTDTVGDNVIDAPAQTDAGPDSAPASGNGFIVTA